MRLTMITLFLLGTMSAFAQEGFTGFKGEHFIEVSGTAEMEIEPNEITLLIRLREFEENKQKVQLEKLDQDFLAALKNAGIDRKRLELADAGSKLSKLGRRDKDAFREKSYQLKLTGAPELEKFLEKLEPVKVDQVTITRLHHTELEKLKMDLKIKALQAARTKAETLLKSINNEIGRTLMVREWEEQPIQPMMDMAANVYMRKQEFSADGEAAETASFRKLRLKSHVAAQFEIK
ncbi:MAG TPA: SIMPL domain-containing protein [Ohtaekwangia sp.]|nr:SIMPL domain-containing protein [Ohtaekwangia sp.]